MPAPESVTLIAAYQVPPGADDDFVARWERERTADAEGDVALYRALRRDVDFRFVAVEDSAEAEADAGLAVPPFTAHAGRYEVVREDGAVETEGGVLLIDPFEVGEDADERFLAGWDRAREVLARQQGYIGTRLHRSAGPADFRYVYLARWSSPLMFARALQRVDFQEAAAALPFPSHPALYQPADG
jgi:heme-degrading monooxygenase HmoA